jgi:hypothetical protein
MEVIAKKQLRRPAACLLLKSTSQREVSPEARRESLSGWLPNDLDVDAKSSPLYGPGPRTFRNRAAHILAGCDGVTTAQMEFPSSAKPLSVRRLHHLQWTHIRRIPIWGGRVADGPG